MLATGPDNFLLRLMDADARDALSLTSVELRARDVLQEPGMPVLFAYFPVSAVVSLISTMENGMAAEVAVVGREGLVGLAGLLGTLESPTSGVVQIPGLAFRTSTATLKKARLRFPSVRTILDRYTRARLIQLAQTAACNRLHSVEARLARWLLAIDDRIDHRRFTLPQELMAQMLGVQRPTVSTTMHRLQQSGAISYRGRSMVVADRSQLERLACECHRVLHREFDGLRRSAGMNVLPSKDQTEPSAESAAALETMRQIAGRLLIANIREQEAREDAEAANRAKDEFLAMVSHELRAPLNAVLGWCSTLEAGGSKHPSLDHGLQVIRQNARAQLKLVEDLLDAARLASSSLRVRTEAAQLDSIVRDAVDAVKPIAADKQVAIQLTIGGRLPPILADVDRLRQVFLNVVMNAVKFTDAGGSVDISVAAAGDLEEVTIRDTGRGIAADLLPHVFERFQQGSALPAAVQGLGLGLTIARELIELHGGDIRIDSPGEGKGATCTISLPVSRPALVG